MNFHRVIVTALAGLSLSACGSLSNVMPDGTTDNPVFPDIRSITYDNGRGIAPNPENLSLVRSGVTKDQLYYLLGRPHFSEGFAPREWDFLFYLNTPGKGTNNVSSCQYKILFDKDMLVRSFYWKPVGPDDVCSNEPPEKVVEQARKVTLEADGLFAFNGSGINDLQQRGKLRLEALSQEIRNQPGVKSVLIIGHTDRLGPEAYNQVLSEKRANSVAGYLVSNGVPSSLITVQGLGESQPLVQCEDVGNRQELIACLAPNRRVEVLVNLEANQDNLEGNQG
ncbi:OmpA family protein [Advenella alkanexedens]|uniref:OmpA family protein n=1 Tax=Advenella alkanexedens TaxID=1481665 RepID=UPI002676C87C|nr:OmpA family protein [Advenella alkanexedens]WKU19430.1 OmpA family protein [Advenella alkanexedens]